MTADNTRSSATSSSSGSSSPRPSVPSSPVSDSLPVASPDPPSPSAHYSPFAEPTNPFATNYNPHAVGLRIYAPQPFGPSPGSSLLSTQRDLSLAAQTSRSPGVLSFERPVERLEHATQPPEETQPSPLSPSFVYVDSSSSRNTAALLPEATSSSSASSAASGLRIAIPPPNVSASTSTPSPPLLQASTTSPLESTPVSITTAGSSHLPREIQPPPTGAFFDPNATSFPPSSDLSTNAADLNLDFAEFDAEGLSALEKIYIFSKSRAGFHRVFIVHALPRYLGAEGATKYASSEETEHISPAEAVEYVLPLLNILAQDEDEAVKEALAVELLPIIWWFITHCRLVEDDAIDEQDQDPYNSQQSGGQMASFDHADVTLIAVQAFTPILGTLLLSQNTLVGGPARHAVVQLLKRMRRADEREGGRTPVQTDGDADDESDHDVGLLGYPERRLFEQEIVHQVVIGMGRLDMPDVDDGPLSSMSTPRSSTGGHHEPHIDHHPISAHDLYPSTPLIPADAPDSSTAGSTPLAAPPSAPDSYFPVMPMPGAPASSPTHSPAASPTSPATLRWNSPSTEQAGSSPTHDTITPSSFRLGQPPPSPLGRPQNVASVSPLSTSASPPALVTSPSTSVAIVQPPSLHSMSLSQPPSHRAIKPVEGMDLPQAPTPTPLSSSSSSMSFTPSLTPSSSASSSTSSSESSLPLHTPSGSSTPTGQALAPLRENLAEDMNLQIDQHIESLIGGPGDIMMAEGGWAPETPDSQLFEMSLGQSRDSSKILSAKAEEVSSTEASPMSAWLSSGLPDPDVQMQDVPGIVPEGTGEGEEDDLSEEAAIGRLSSMSLMAAVTASGTLEDETKAAFVAEVARVGRDPVHWVRREAAFAVGALAKVVPDELVDLSLLPLFKCLYQDPTWHVRQSVLFALPAILSRLPPSRRRTLALDVILPLSSDESPTVRSAVLEALGEVMHTFVDTEHGPPAELLNLFLGIRADDYRPSIESRSSPTLSQDSRASWGSQSMSANANADIYDDPARPLVCAFNLPAVALTLGRERWPELRNLYRTLAQGPSFKVRRTLAAALGEMAKIVGPQYAREDLMDVWRASIRAEETDVRLKVVECTAVFVSALDIPERVIAVRELGEEFTSGRLRGWREREEFVKSLAVFLTIRGVEEDVLKRLLMQALGDRVSAIREAAVAVMPAFVRTWRSAPRLMTSLREDVRALAYSDSYRQRTTFVNCEQAVLLSENSNFVLFDDSFWDTLLSLSRDPIVDVRIRVARLLGTIADDHVRDVSIMTRVLALADRLGEDSSQDVKAFALRVKSRNAWEPVLMPFRGETTSSAMTFSRPPPPAPS